MRDTPAESPTILTRGSARRRHHAVSWSVPYGRGGRRAADNGITNDAHPTRGNPGRNRTGHGRDRSRTGNLYRVLVGISVIYLIM